MSDTNLKWKCKLSSFGYGEIASGNFSGGEGTRVSIARSEEFYGLSRFFSTSLRFYKDLHLYIQQVYEEKGTEHEIVIKIYESVQEPVNKFELFFEGLIDLSTYINDEDKFIEADINESSFARKLFARKDIKVSIGETTSIEGVTLPANNEVTVNLHQRELLSTGNYEVNEAAATVESFHVVDGGVGWDGFTLPIFLFSQDEDVSNLSSQDNPIISTAAGMFWDAAGRASIATITGEVAGTLKDIFVSQPNGINVDFRFRVYVDDTRVVIQDDFIISGSDVHIPQSPTEVAFSFAINETFENVTADNVISLICVRNDGTTYQGFEGTFTKTDISVSQNLQWSDLTPAKGYLMHEVGERISQVITDTETAFVSQLFGRTDIGYENTGEQALISFHSGSQIRQLPDVKPAITLSDWFKSMNSVLNLGLGIEYDSTSQPFIRVEKKAHFFNGTVIATIHNVSKMTKTVAREWIYSNIKYGYDNSAPEELNGTQEYNNKQERATVIKSIKNELDLISLIRADGVGLEKMRRLAFATDPTTDAKEDNDNWLVDVIADGANYKSAKNEAFDVVENIFSPESAYNLDKSPLRNFKRNGNVVRAGLEKNLDDLIKFMPTGVKNDMITKKPAEVLNVIENEDLSPLKLDAPLWVPEFYNCEFVLTREFYQSILKNQGGIVKLSTTDAQNTTNYNYGWINKIDYDPEKDISVGEFLRVNLNNPDLELIDPEGNSPDVPPPQPPDPANYGGFEGAFPFVFAGPAPEAPTNAYNFTGIEKVTVPGVPDFERTSTLYYVANIINKESGNQQILWDNLAANNRGLSITIDFSDKLSFRLQNTSVGFNTLLVVSNVTIPEDVNTKVEIWYTGNSAASGVTMSINDTPVGTTASFDQLTATTLTGSNGYSFGVQKNNATVRGAYVLDDKSITIDSVEQFNTECANDDPDCTDLSAQGNDGTVDRDVSTEEEFYITV